MRVLWISFVLFPEASVLSGKEITHRGSGGWLFAAAEALLDTNLGIELRVATVSPGIKEFVFLHGERTDYYLIPYGRGFNKYHHGYDEYWKAIKNEFHPDVVHVHGIESSLALSYMNVCGNENVVCSIQGLFNVIARYMFYGLPKRELLFNTTLRDVIRGSYFRLQRDYLRRQGFIEDTMKKGRYFIGRTSWDRAHLWAVNPNAEYLYCNETLRRSFYTNKWAYKNCQPHSIFLSSIKGLPLFLRALRIVVKYYPDVVVRIAGDTSISKRSFRDRIRRTGYEKLVINRINRYELSHYLFFLGSLSEDEIRKEYLQANVFVNPSQIENSSNSVGEAQLMGVPLIASYVGGMSDLIPDISCGIMYRFDEYEMLARAICDVFEMSRGFDNSRMIAVAKERHDKTKNAMRTASLYQYIKQNTSIE